MTTSSVDEPATPSVPPYPSTAGIFDEMLAADGVARPHWQGLVNSFAQLGVNELAARHDTAARVLRENGVTYNIYSDHQGLGRPWALDLVPMVLPPDEWRALEAGLTQRARLLNLILADLYGPQSLLRDGTLPPALLYANPAFLRPCHGIIPPNGTFLFLHAVDLARSPDGRWWALSDRTQAPSGAGYTLENRIVLSRVLPDEFRELRAERLAHFFQVMRDTLRNLPAQRSEQPNVVLLTPGPYNETYSEHVYLARYLGFPLVEGGDLTVRNQRVFLKTLEGLQPVDVIIRRADDTFCDPLELRSDSILGLPGLVEAARAGHVVIANALGSGAVETPALAAFLPALARRLLGEELKLPTVATWWCGQPGEFEYVRDNLERLVIKPAFGRINTGPFFTRNLGEKERAALLTQMQAAPYNFVAQERVALSTAPAWESGKLEPRAIVLRTYTCASGDGYTVMPGGLTRFSHTPDQLVVSMQNGGGSKDTWVISEGPVNQLTLLLPAAPLVRRERTATEVPSRVADNLYWTGRYAERLEDTLRLIRCTLVRVSGDVGREETPELVGLVQLLVNLELFPPSFRQKYSLTAIEREIFQLIYRRQRLGTVLELQGRLSNIAFALRDRFTADTWRILNKLQADTRPRTGTGRIPIAEMVAMLDTLIMDLAAFAGMAMENMTRGHGWRFLDVGRRIERAANIGSLVRSSLQIQTAGWTVLDPVLEVADSVMTYRRRYFSQPEWPPALDLLLADETNPRSLAFQIEALADHMSNLPAEPNRPQETRATDALRALIRDANWANLGQTQLTEKNNVLDELLANIAAELRNLSDAVSSRYFSHATPRAS